MYRRVQRVESSVTSISWIPAAIMEGVAKLPFQMLCHYDDPPPDFLDDLERLRRIDAFRFANELRAWIEIEDNRIVAYGHDGKGYVGVTRVRLGPGHVVAFPAVAMPELRPLPTVTPTSVQFVQTAGGHTGMPVPPRRVDGKPFIQLTPPLAWTTLGLTIHVDGSSHTELLGASTFPRHWMYDHTRRVVAESGLIDFGRWSREVYGMHTPWGHEDSPVVVTHAASTLERELARSLLGGHGALPMRKLDPGDCLVRQGEPGSNLFLLLDGVLAVEVDDQPIAESGPGTLLGEGALLGTGRRTATLRATTPCRVAVLHPEQVDRRVMSEVAQDRRRDPTGLDPRERDPASSRPSTAD